MYPPGHVGLTALLFAPVVCWFRLTGRRRTATECLTVAIVLSLLPDIDALLPGLVHRGVTHTPVAAIVAGGAVAVLVRYHDGSGLGLAGEHAALPYLVGTAGVVSHLLADVVTPMGIRLLFPLRETVYTLAIVPARSPAANTLLLVTGVAAIALSYSVGPAAAGGTAEELSLLPSGRR